MRNREWKRWVNRWRGQKQSKGEEEADTKKHDGKRGSDLEYASGQNIFINRTGRETGLEKRRLDPNFR